MTTITHAKPQNAVVALQLCAGLLTEAGEMCWPGYERLSPNKESKPPIYYFTWHNIGVHLPEKTIIYAGLYDAKRGGNLIGMREILAPQHAHIRPEDSITLRWPIRLT